VSGVDEREHGPRLGTVSPLEPGDPRRVGDYALIGRLGVGGMGTVYLGRPVGAGAAVGSPTAQTVAAGTGAGGPLAAVKVVHRELAADAEFRARFAGEVAAARRVAPFCTARVLGADPAAEPPYLATEYIDGVQLGRAVTEGGPLEDSTLHGVAVGVAAALAAIHAAGVVHRDLKPSNVLLSLSGPRVIDFGIARALDAAAGHTSAGTVVGTPGWMAPEQLHAGRVGPAADVFSWGSLVGYAATGRNPWGEEGPPAALAYRIIYQQPDLVGLVGPLRLLVEAALRKDPARRPAARDLVLGLLGAATVPGADPTVAATRLLRSTWAGPPTLAVRPGGVPGPRSPSGPRTAADVPAAAGRSPAAARPAASHPVGAPPRVSPPLAASPPLASPPLASPPLASPPRVSPPAVAAAPLAAGRLPAGAPAVGTPAPRPGALRTVARPRTAAAPPGAALPPRTAVLPPWAAAPPPRTAVLPTGAEVPRRRSGPARRATAPPYQPPPYQPTRPARQPRRRRRWYRKKRYLIPLALLVLLLVSSASGHEPTDGSTAPSGGSSATPATQPAADTRPQLGVPVRDGQLEFVLTRWRCGVPEIGEGIWVRPASGQYCLADIEVHNIGRGSRTLFEPLVKVHDQDGTTYDADVRGRFYLGEDGRALWAPLDPGGEASGTVAFDVPESAHLVQLELHDGLLSGGTRLLL